MIDREERNGRPIAAVLLLLGFRLGFPVVVIGAPGMGGNSPLGGNLPFLFDPVSRKYWSIAFVVVTLYGPVILETVLRRAGDHNFSRIGMVSFALATGIWIVGHALDFNGVPGGRDLKSYFITHAFLANIAYGLGLLRTRVLAALDWGGDCALVDPAVCPGISHWGPALL